MFKRGVFLWVLLYPALASSILLNLNAQTGNISGTVTDSSRQGSLVGALVKAEGQGRTTSTDAAGRYLMLAVPAGTVKVTVSYLGLESVTHEVTVQGGATATLD